MFFVLVALVDKICKYDNIDNWFDAFDVIGLAGDSYLTNVFHIVD